MALLKRIRGWILLGAVLCPSLAHAVAGTSVQPIVPSSGVVYGSSVKTLTNDPSNFWYDAANKRLNLFNLTIGGTCIGCGGGGSGGGIVSPGTFTWQNPFGINMGAATIGSVVMPSTAPVGNFQMVYWNNGVPSFGDAPGFSMPDGTAYNTLTSSFNPTGGVFNDGFSPLSSGAAAGTRITPNRAFHVNLRNNSGTEIGTNANPIATTAASLPLPSNASQETGGNLASIASNAGATTDAAVTSDVNSTLSAKLRGMVKIFGDVWDSANHRLNTFIQNATLAVTQSGTWSVNQSGTWTVGQSGAWTVQPGNTQNTTAWLVQTSTSGVNASTMSVVNAAGTSLKVDGSAVTQPVSGTLAATQSGTWTVQPGNTANTTAWKVDGSAVTQPVSGTVTSNQGGAPWANRLQDGSGATLGAIDATFKALRINARPYEALGFYAAGGTTGTYGGLSANTPLFSFRWGDATHLAVILKVQVMVITTAPASTAALTERQLIIARSFTVSDTGGTAITLTGNNQKRRTSMGTSLVTDLRYGNPLTAGTRTLDSAPVATVAQWLPISVTGTTIHPTMLLDALAGNDHPIVLAQNEGVIVQLGAVQPSGSTQQTFVNIVWAEVNAF